MSLVYLIFDFIINLLVTIINLVLSPINAIIGILIPDFSIITLKINQVFDFLSDTINFVLSWLHLPQEVYTLIVAYIDFIVIFIPVSLGFKLAIRFYHHFKA